MISRELREKLTPLLAGERPAFATTLLSGLLMVYGEQVLEWDALTTQLEIKDDFDVDMPRKVFNKLMALITAISTDAVYTDIAVFDRVVHALNDHGITHEHEPPSADDVAWAVAELQLTDPEPVSRNPERPWSTDIQKYARVVLDEEGLNIAPKTLDFAVSRPLPKEGMDDAQYYSGAWGNAQARADEVDDWVEEQAVELVGQLTDLGVPLTAG